MKLNKEEYDDILEIKKAGERAASLTRQLLAFSRKQLLQPEVLNINNLIKNVERMLIRIIGEDIELKTFLETQIHNVKADRIQIEQIILNLTVNARDAMPKGGILTIETQNIFLDEAYARIHGEVAIGNYVMLSITDNGIGMDKATRERIFEPFFSTKGINKGTGLGLATVYGIVKQSNGYIWVYSELGKGSSFKIYLPAFEISTSIENDKKEDLVNLMGNETILVVEDEKSVRRIVERTLKEYGYNLICYTDVFKAIEDVKMYKKEIHMLLSDVVMPKLSGVDFYEEIRKFYPEIKVCFMSGYTDESISRHGVLQRGVNFIQKPFSTIELAKKVRKVLDSE